MWVQLLAIKHLSQNGEGSRPYYPGDWVEVGKQTAIAWLAEGQARLFDLKEITLGDGMGIVVPDQGKAEQLATNLGTALAVSSSGGDSRPASLPYPRTLLWDATAALRLELLATGFHLLDTWEIASPLWSYDELAESMGSRQERTALESVIHDLRVPVYDHRILFMRDCQASHDVLARWSDFAALGWDTRLALLAALFVVRPLLLALPISWRREGGRR